VPLGCSARVHSGTSPWEHGITAGCHGIHGNEVSRPVLRRVSLNNKIQNRFHNREHEPYEMHINGRSRKAPIRPGLILIFPPGVILQSLISLCICRQKSSATNYSGIPCGKTGGALRGGTALGRIERKCQLCASDYTRIGEQRSVSKVRGEMSNSFTCVVHAGDVKKRTESLLPHLLLKPCQFVFVNRI